MFCIKCGGPAFADNFCEKCYLEKKELFFIKKVKLNYCDNCGKFYTQKEKMNAKELENFLLNQLNAKNTIKNSEIILHAEDSKITGTIIANGFVKPSKTLITDKKEFLIYPRRMKCDSCVKILGNYHEAVIQIRGDEKDKILHKAQKLLREEDYANIATLKEGYDIRVIKKAVAAQIVQALRVKYTIKPSFKLVGEKKGKKIYRNFYSVK
jgi:NMD protein affecting ribosome stability and mRNA decay